MDPAECKKPSRMIVALIALFLALGVVSHLTLGATDALLGACGRDRADRWKGMMSGIHRWIEEASLSRYMDRLDANQMREPAGTESEPAGTQANFRRLRANCGDPGRAGRHVEAVLRIDERSGPVGGSGAVRAKVR